MHRSTEQMDPKTHQPLPSLPHTTPHTRTIFIFIALDAINLVASIAVIARIYRKRRRLREAGMLSRYNNTEMAPFLDDLVRASWRSTQCAQPSSNCMKPGS